MNLMKLYLTILIFCISASTMFAQKKLPINLEKVLELAGVQSLTIQEYQQQQMLAEAKLIKAKEWWVPQIFAGAQTHQLSGAVMNGNGRFFLDIERNNLNLGLGAEVSWDFAQGIYNTKAAKFQSLAAVAKSEALQNEEKLSIIHTYYDFLLAQMKWQAYAELVQQSEFVSEQIQIHVDAGIKPQSDWLISKGHLNHLKIEMLEAQKVHELTSTYLTELLNIEMDITLFSTDTSLVPLENNNSLLVSTDTTFKNRGEIKENTYLGKSLSESRKIYTTGWLIPQLNIVGSTAQFGQLNGEVIPIDPIAFPNTNQLYGTGILNASVGWNLPLGSIFYKGDIKKYEALITLNQIEAAQLKQSIKREIKAAEIKLNTAREQIEMAKEAMELMSEALMQNLDRQNIGTAKPFEVFQSQQFYLQAKLDYYTSIANYNKAHFSMKVAKGEKL